MNTNDYRILLIGNAGSGKSTLARELAVKLDLPVLHLDRIFHHPDFKGNMPAYYEYQFEFMRQHDNFIIDGNSSGSLAKRSQVANLVIWFQFPRRVTISRVILRSIKVRLGLIERPDIADEFSEKFDREYWEFMKYIWNFPKTQYPRFVDALAHKADDCRVVVVKNKKDIDVLLKQLTR